METNSWEPWTDDFGHTIGVHAESVCAKPCAIHGASNHPLKDAPILYRVDRGILERVCVHGVGHHDPDDLAEDKTHGCDGCCVGKDYDALRHR